MIGKEILNYRIEKLIGQGGMGSVYLAINKNIDQKVAIKVLNANLANSSIVRERFKSEATLLCSLDHPNIVNFLNYVENEEGVFLIMEYVEGVTLEEYILKKTGPIVEDRAFDMFHAILNAFEYAHKHGIVHRDIKPSNIIITNNQNIKVLDFGIARIISESNEKEKGLIMGTPMYMSPEQVRGEEVDARSDIYSLGVLLHQMLTGQAPYNDTTMSDVEIKAKVLEEKLPPMKEYYPYVSDKVQAIVNKAIEKEPTKRYQTCEEFRKDFVKALRPEPIPRMIKWISAAAILIILLTVGFIWDYNRTKIYYYKDYVEKWGVPQGIHKLSSNEVKHRLWNYRFEYTKYKLVRMSYVNSKGSLIDHNSSDEMDRPIDMLLFYTSDNKLDYVKYRDRNEKVLYVKDYNEQLNVAVFKHDDEFGTEMNLAANSVTTFSSAFTDNQANKSKISRYLLTYDEDGHVIDIKYAGFQNIRVGDKDGIFGRKYILDEKGRVKEEHFLGLDEKPKATKSGMGIRTWEYNDNDDAVRFTYLTIDRQPSGEAGLGIPVCENEFDKYGNEIRQVCKDMEGNLSLRKDANIAGFEYELNDEGQKVMQRYIGTDGKPCYSSTDGICGAKMEYDKNGYLIKMSYLDENGQPTLSKDGSSQWIAKTDNHGNYLEQTTFDLNGKPTETTNGYTTWRAEYDSLGNQTRYALYNAKDSLIIGKSGFAAVNIEYDKQNRAVKYVYYDENNKPFGGTNDIICIKYDYSPQGNITRYAYYDASETKLAHSNEMIAGCNSVFDDNGNEIERSFFDDQNRPTTGTIRYAKWTAKYDEQGNQTEIRYYGLDGKLTMTSEGYAGIRYRYDKRGNITDKMEFGTDERLAPSKLHATYKYDEHDNQIEWAFFNIDNKPALNSAGCHKGTQIYNNRNQVIETRYFGTDGKPINLKEEKYAVEMHDYDKQGNNIMTQYKDANNKNCICKDGWSSSKREFDQMGRVIKQYFYDINGKPTDPKIMIPVGIAEYDKWGNMNYIAAYDGEGNRVLNQSGYSSCKKEFDLRGNEISIAYFDTDDKPIELKDEGYAKMEAKYNAQNLLVEQRFYATNGKLRTGKIAIVKNQYDTDGNKIEEAYFDSKEKPCVGNGGYCKIIYSNYREDGYATVAKTYALNGTVSGTYHWSDSEGWVSNSGSTRDSQPTSGWQSYFENSKSSLPLKLADGIFVTAISTSAKAASLTVKFSEFSKYDLSESKIDEIRTTIESLADTWKQEAKMPSSARIIVVIIDKANRELTKINK